MVVPLLLPPPLLPAPLLEPLPLDALPELAPLFFDPLAPRVAPSLAMGHLQPTAPRCAKTRDAAMRVRANGHATRGTTVAPVSYCVAMIKALPSERCPDRLYEDASGRLAATLRAAFPLPKSGAFHHLLQALDETDARRREDS